jgi:SAM-dependent methyltransferase
MFQGYGMLFEEDEIVIETCLTALLPKPVVSVLEIGTYEGHTARGIKRFLEAHGSSIQYWGIDPGKDAPGSERFGGANPSTFAKPPFPGANFVNACSDVAFHLVPDDFHLILVDGSHSRNAVVLDTANYHRKVAPGGFMLFHDTNPKCQRTGYEPPGPHIPEFGNCVNEALELIHFPWPPWVLFMDKYPLDHHQNGMRAYRNGPKP